MSNQPSKVMTLREAAGEIEYLRTVIKAMIEHFDYVSVDSYYADETRAVMAKARSALGIETGVKL